MCFCDRVHWLNQYWPGGLCFLWVYPLCPGTPEGSIGSGSGFKASQKTGQRLKVVSSDRLGEAGNRTCEPWFTRQVYLLHHGGFSEIKRVKLSLDKNILTHPRIY